MWQFSCTLLFFLLAGAILPLSTHAQVQLSGIVADEDGESLPGAQIEVLGSELGTVSDNKGYFQLRVSALPVELRVSFIGFAPRRILLENDPGRLDITLRAESYSLDAVEIFSEHAKQEVSLPTYHLDADFFKERGDGTFAQALNVLPGISAINVGTGIAKPVIRGLYGNRILVNQNGIKQEGQQWGNDHGLEIDPFDVDRVEIIKGPSALQYGSDAMGGVINIAQQPIPEANKIHGSVLSLYKSNNDQWAGSAQLRGQYRNVFFSTRYSHQNFGDFSVPSDSFVYNGFTLPLFEGQVKNTAGRENNFHLLAGYKGKNSVTRIKYSRYHLLGGIFSGAIGIPRSYTLLPDGDARNIEVPFQDVRHEKIILNQSFLLGDHHLILNFGYQENDRQEHSNPEFHSVRSSEIDPNETLGLGLLLRTWSANGHFEWQANPNQKWVLGANAQWQDHERRGFEFLLPDYQTFRSGAYIIGEWQARPHWTINGGGRFDYGRNETQPYTQLIFSSNENILDSLTAIQTNTPFTNYSLALGGQYEPETDWSLKMNIARSFRIPYPNETVSNGVHHGTFRHEQGNPDLSAETGYQLDASALFERTGTRVELNTYINYFQDFIYLRPTARFSRLPEAGQLFRYTQHDALFTGLEWQWDQKIWGPLHYRSGFEWVYSLNLTEDRYLPFTPPSSYVHSLRYEWQPKNESLAGALSAEHRWTQAQNRVDRNERTTPGYHLFRLQANMVWKMDADAHLRWDIEVQNLFNTPYLRHLSRYRLLNLPEQGRNLIFRLSYHF